MSIPRTSTLTQTLVWHHFFQWQRLLSHSMTLFSLSRMRYSLFISKFSEIRANTFLKSRQIWKYVFSTYISMTRARDLIVDCRGRWTNRKTLYMFLRFFSFTVQLWVHRSLKSQVYWQVDFRISQIISVKLVTGLTLSTLGCQGMSIHYQLEDLLMIDAISSAGWISRSCKPNSHALRAADPYSTRCDQSDTFYLSRVSRN